MDLMKAMDNYILSQMNLKNRIKIYCCFLSLMFMLGCIGDQNEKSKVSTLISSLESGGLEQLEWIVEKDSIEFVLGLNPTFMKNHFDTIVPQSTNECDFAIVLYEGGVMDLERVNCSKLRHEYIDIERLKFIKGDSINLQLYQCHKMLLSESCRVRIW